MKRLSVVLTAVVLSCVIAAFLQLVSLAPLSPPNESPAQAVVSLAFGDELNDQNLVDYMARMTLSVGIRKLDWQEPVLYADFYAKEQGLKREQLFAAIEEVMLFGLSSMQNVNLMMIRLYEGNDRDAPLLLAVTADREKVQDHLDHAEVQTSEAFVRHASRVQFAPRWPKWVEQY